ncbi:hypothetical protein BKA66DRAFT_602682 [Pyrenochaeta sp. MPI-SDFR-AT-0127]|nr:hypothetical protein BKA66DRAFT_602682 [Pyrenochaeta sp. MPI-SDFR-AT-0127]
MGVRCNGTHIRSYWDLKRQRNDKCPPALRDHMPYFNPNDRWDPHNQPNYRPTPSNLLRLLDRNKETHGDTKERSIASSPPDITGRTTHHKAIEVAQAHWPRGFKNYEPPSLPMCYSPWKQPKHSKAPYYTLGPVTNILKGPNEPRSKPKGQEDGTFTNDDVSTSKLHSQQGRFGGLSYSNRHDLWATRFSGKPQPQSRKTPEEYEALSKEVLRSEADKRRLDFESDEKAYLVRVLIISDEAFSEKYCKLEHLDAAQLRDEAILKHTPLDTNKYYKRRELLAIIAGKYSRDAVMKYNQDLEQQKHAEMRAANERARKRARHERARKAAEMDIRLKGKRSDISATKMLQNSPTKPEPCDPTQLNGRRKQQGSRSIDSGYSTSRVGSPISTPTFDQGSRNIEMKGKKRQRTNHEGGDEMMPSKTKRILRPCRPPQVVKSPRTQTTWKSPCSQQATKDSSHKLRSSHPSKRYSGMSKVEHPISFSVERLCTSKKHYGKTAITPTHQDSSRRNIRSSRTAEDLESVSRCRKRKRRIEQDEDDDDWLEDDVNYRPKRKSRVGQMAASGLVAGMK